jgi:cell division protein FtsI (penicillin-binding protein 3)
MAHLDGQSPKRTRASGDLGEGARDTAAAGRGGFGYVPAWRAGLVVFVLCAMFAAFVARAYHVQVTRADELQARAESQLTGQVRLQARRGAIYDRNGDEMAVSVRASNIFVRPAQVEDPRATARALAPILRRPEADLYEALTADTNFRYLVRGVAPSVWTQVRALDLPGIDHEASWQRYYPMRSRAGLLLGFTDRDGVGLEGIESAYEETLRGGSMTVSGLRDAHGRTVIRDDAPSLEDLEGSSLVLTIDAQIQRAAEQVLEQTVLEQDARTGSIIVMDPNTGEVLAMTSWPHFDPNLPRTGLGEAWRNRSIADTWEPGSTFKVFTYAAAIEAGVINENTPIDCANGRMRIGQHTIRDTHREAIIPAQQVVQVSSNIGTYRIADMLGEDRLEQAFRDFGFGTPTGVPLRGERAGLVAETPWARIELANRAFGQGVTTTPLQMAAAYSAIANGGMLLRPMLVREVRNKDGEVTQTFAPEVVRRVISERTARIATAALESVTRAPGTGRRAALPGVRVAGKTGTAQKVVEGVGYGDLWMSSFVGFVPADDPMFTILVMIDEPQVGHYGGEVAAPAFASVAEVALATRGIFVEREDDPEDPAPAEVSDAADGVASVPEADADADPSSLLGWTPTPSAGDDRVIVPDLSGLTLIEALAEAERLGITLRTSDWGVVRHQWPAPGASVPIGSEVELYLRAPYTVEDDPLSVRRDRAL